MAARKNRDEEEQRTERLLYQKKWFDYRFITPDVATLWFVYEFAKQYRIYQEDRGGSRYMDFLCKLDVDAPRSWKSWKYMERLRRFADEHGLPYEMFWSCAIKAHVDLKFRNPFVNSFGNERLLERALQYCDEHRASVIEFSSFKFFLVDRYVGSEIQNAYFKYLVRAFQDKYGSSASEKIIRLVDERRIPRAYFFREKRG